MEGPGKGYVVAANGCWEWQGRRDRLGYGIVGRHTKAHRLFYERFLGPIPAAYEVHHRCGNRACVNPTHLEAVDRIEHRSMPRRRWRWARRRLSDDEVRELRVRLAAGERQADVARQFGISPSLVCDIVHGRRYAEAGA